MRISLDGANNCVPVLGMAVGAGLGALMGKIGDLGLKSSLSKDAAAHGLDYSR